MSFGDDVREREPRRPTPLDLRVRVLTALDTLGPDEAEVLSLVATRLAMGRRAYGELHPATDPRSFAREALEECCDGLVYAAAGLVKAGARGL